MSFSMTRRTFLARSGQTALGAGLTGALLAACGSSPATSSGPVTLTYGWWSNGPDHDNAMKSWIQVFEKANPNITIKPEILPWANYWDKVKTTTAGGNAYDIIGMAGGNAAPYFDQGVLYDLSQFSDYQTVSANLLPTINQLSSWKSKPYVIPVGTYVPTLGYNKNLLQAAGIAPLDPATPMTFEAFKAMAAKLTKKQGNTYVQYALHPAYFFDLDTFVLMEGGQVYDNLVAPTKITINTPEGIKGLEDYLSLFTENLAVPFDLLSNGPWGTGDIASLQTGKIAFARTGAYDFSQLGNTYGIAPMPTVNGNHVVLGNANSFAIYQGSKHPQEAWEFLKWTTQVSTQLSFSKFSDLPTNKSALTQSQLDTAVAPTEYVPALLSDLSAFKPYVLTTNQQIATVFGDITTDLVHGKITPAQAAAQMEQKGNAALASS